MGRRTVSDEQLNTLLTHYREHPPSSWRDFKQAAEATGLDPRTARRAFTTGWPTRRALREVLLEEQVAARAALAREALQRQRQDAGALAVEDAAVTAAAEALIARGVRGHASALLAALAPAREVVRQLVDRLKDGADTISLEEAPAVIRAVVGAVKDVSGLSHAALELERLRVGDPSVVIGLKPMAPDRPLPELEAEYAAQTAAAQRALERARRGGDDTTGGGGVVH